MADLANLCLMYYLPSLYKEEDEEETKLADPIPIEADPSSPFPSLQAMWDVYDEELASCLSSTNRRGKNREIVGAVDRANWPFHVSFLLFKQTIILQVLLPILSLLPFSTSFLYFHEFALNRASACA